MPTAGTGYLGVDHDDPGLCDAAAERYVQSSGHSHSAARHVGSAHRGPVVTGEPAIAVERTQLDHRNSDRGSAATFSVSIEQCHLRRRSAPAECCL